MVCDSWEQYQAGECWGCEGDRCGVMGFPSRPINPQPPPPAAGSSLSWQNVDANDPEETGEETNAKIRKSRRGVGKRRRRGRGRGRGRGNRRGRKAGEGNRVEEVTPMKVFFGTVSEQPYCGEYDDNKYVGMNTPYLLTFGVTKSHSHLCTHTYFLTHKNILSHILQTLTLFHSPPAEQYAVSVLTTTSPKSVRGGGDLGLFTVTLKSPAATYTFPTPDRCVCTGIVCEYQCV